ncbi:hypothetical protein [Micromonospora tarensis]|uniref:Uncharacterized protein n=1 Tax=Micromonospora tarensis TaxID=2806100 RepID=A0ABS1YD89_9ACTN|nr:hypothetical protein [Micromonospora tarensis]MBM0275340.1 hypothetical protein [Micromonospora tarensis]
MAQTPGSAVDLIEHASGIIVAAMEQPHSAPYHWAGALWEAGMLHGPGSVPDREGGHHLLAALRSVLADRERELLDLKGPCSGAQGQKCRLHYAHSGPCDIEPTRKP